MRGRLDNIAKANPSALSLARLMSLSDLGPSESTALHPVEQERFDRAKRLPVTAGYDLAQYPITIVEDLGEGIYGLAKEDRIFIAKAAFQKGTKEVASTSARRVRASENRLRGHDAPASNMAVRRAAFAIRESSGAALNIAQRIAAVMGEVDYVQKERKQGMNYSIVSHDAVTAKVRPLLHKHGVIYYPRALTVSQNGNRTEAVFTVRFENIDDRTDFIDVETFGYGVDPQDKGPGKAMSYGVKYALLKVLGLETGDDPDTVQERHHRASDGSRLRRRDSALPRVRRHPTSASSSTVPTPARRS
jgi:hypothetical protein